MAATDILDLPTLALRLELPAGWEVDESGLPLGSLVVRSPDGWTDGFRPNLVLTQARLSADTATEPDQLLAEQHAVDPVLADELRDYRVIHLGMEELGKPAVAAVHRVAIYTTAQGLPVTMAQWMARGLGRESTLTFTFPTADSALGIDGARALAAQLEWKGSGA